MSRVFPQFNKDNICPICQTNNNEASVLVPNYDSKEEGCNIVQADLIHLNCILDRIYIYRNCGFVPLAQEVE